MLTNVVVKLNRRENWQDGLKMGSKLIINKLKIGLHGSDGSDRAL